MIFINIEYGKILSSSDLIYRFYNHNGWLITKSNKSHYLICTHNIKNGYPINIYDDAFIHYGKKGKNMAYPEVTDEIFKLSEILF